MLWKWLNMYNHIDNNVHSFQLEGHKGDKGQASSSSFDEKTNVLFMTQLQRDGIACWNPRTRLEANNFVLVAQDHEKLIFTNDISVSISNK